MATTRDSPTPPPPTPSTPGPRATALQKLYNDAISHILKTCSYTNFSACFPTPATQVPTSVKLLHEQFTTKLGQSMRKEFDAILEERGVIASLNELDKLVEDARKRKASAMEKEAKGEGMDSVIPVPAHTLPARQLFISHLAPTLKGYEANISEKTGALEKENLEIWERVQTQRRDIGKLMEGLEGIVGDLKGSVGVLEEREGDVEGLREEARELDEEMRD